MSDLALILVVAGAVTLLFKKLRQPLVLGYIVAGFLVSPHMPYTMSVVDKGDVEMWAENGEVALFPGDQLQVIGDDDQLTRFAQAMRTEVHDEDAEIEKREMRLQQIIVGQKSPFFDQTLRESGIRDRYNCMVVGLDEGEKNLTIITPNYRFALGDVLWIVGEEQNVKGLQEANGEE